VATALAPATYTPPAALPSHAAAVVFDAPGQLALRDLALKAPGDADVVVDVEWSGVSAGTERLLWRGTMPVFPGMGYPLVPGYETVGRVRWAGPESGHAAGARVFLPGATASPTPATCSAARPRRSSRPAPARTSWATRRAVRSARTASCWPSPRRPSTPCRTSAPGAGAVLPDLVVGHGALGRLARGWCSR
jgi:3-hydroxyethyl bacteriochlorophyllide a dehydrogenase